jgi:hypothetical protein
VTSGGDSSDRLYEFGYRMGRADARGMAGRLLPSLLDDEEFCMGYADGYGDETSDAGAAVRRVERLRLGEASADTAAP